MLRSNSKQYVLRDEKLRSALVLHDVLGGLHVEQIGFFCYTGPLA